MKQTELATALDGVATNLTAVSDQLVKATNEIVTAVGNQGNTTPEVDAAVAKLQTISDALAPIAKALDDLNQDVQPT